VAVAVTAVCFVLVCGGGRHRVPAVSSTGNLIVGRSGSAIRRAPATLEDLHPAGAIIAVYWALPEGAPRTSRRGALRALRFDLLAKGAGDVMTAAAVRASSSTIGSRTHLFSVPAVAMALVVGGDFIWVVGSRPPGERAPLEAGTLERRDPPSASRQVRSLFPGC